MSEIQLRDVQCPYCGESVVLQLDGSAGDQDYVEDCAVCCRPMEVRLACAVDGSVSVALYRDDE